MSTALPPSPLLLILLPRDASALPAVSPPFAVVVGGTVCSRGWTPLLLSSYPVHAVTGHLFTVTCYPLPVASYLLHVNCYLFLACRSVLLRTYFLLSPS